MQDNEYNLITFQNEAYTENAKFEITPTPDSLLSVFMTFKPLDKPIEVKLPEITPFERDGFTVVEWAAVE